MSGGSARWAVGIVVPARNEEQSIAATVASVRAALSICRLVGSWIVVVCDSCTDTTASFARRALGETGEIIECQAGCVGAARALGVEAVALHFNDIPKHRLWIANTDADTTVPIDWISRQLPFADKGWAAIAGIVRVDSIDGERGSIVDRALADYAVDSDGGHSHVHGANLGFRADDYVSVGSWRHVALAEDHCLWNRLQAGKWPTLSTADVVVTTSGRLTGRAVGGFADTLRAKLAKK